MNIAYTHSKTEDLIDKEVLTNQTNVVSHLLENEVIQHKEIENLYTYTVELSSGEDLITTDHLKLIEFRKGVKNELNKEILMTAKEKLKNLQNDLDAIDNVEAEPQEIHEWYLVTDWLAEKLLKHGEPVIRKKYLGTWWGRCCIGQALYMDIVLQKITAENEG